MWGYPSLLRFGSAGQKIASDQRQDRVNFAPIERKRRGTIPEKRSVIADLTNNFGMFLDSPASSGVAVNETSALNVAAVTACVGLLANMMAKLPIYLYQDTPSGPQELPEHPAIQLIGHYPGGNHTSFELRQLMETGKGLGGNGYARVYRDKYRMPAEIQWLKPCDVNPDPFKETATNYKTVKYHVTGEKNWLGRDEIIHVKGFSRDGIMGISPIRMLRESIGTALTQTSAAGALMKNGARFPGVLTTDQILKPDTLKEIKSEWDRNTTNGALGSSPVLHGGLKYMQTNGMSMVDAQFLESRRFELQEIARIYGVPTFLIGDTTNATSFGTGIEQMTLGFLNFCLDPHLVGWEQSLGFTLLSADEQRQGLYFKFDRDQLANVALEARSKFYQAMITMGVYSPNDVRRKEGEKLISPEDGGDTYGNPNVAPANPPTPTLEPESIPA